MNNTDYGQIDFEDVVINDLEPSLILKDIIDLSFLTVRPLRFIDLSPSDYAALKMEVGKLSDELDRGELFGVSVQQMAPTASEFGVGQKMSVSDKNCQSAIEGEYIHKDELCEPAKRQKERSESAIDIMRGVKS